MPLDPCPYHHRTRGVLRVNPDDEERHRGEAGPARDLGGRAMITTTCTTCRRETSVPVTHGRVVLDPSGDVLALRCTRCAQLVAKPLTAGLTATLLRHGATPTPSPLQPPNPERRPLPDAQPFTEDDVLALHQLLPRVRTPADVPGLAASDAVCRPSDVDDPVATADA